MKRFAQKLFLFSIYLFLYFPLFILVAYSFNSAKYSLQWHGFSLHWYQVLFQDQDLWTAFFHSLALGFSAALFSTVLGLGLCVQLFFFPRLYHRYLQDWLLLLIIIPDLILGIALLIFFNFLHFPLGFFTLLIAHITFCLPFVILTLKARFMTLDPAIYFSALDLGANHYKALVRIIFPLIWPAILSAFLLCFTLSFDDIMISYFVAGPDYEILPLAIYSMVRTGITPELNALCSIIFLLSILSVWLSYRLSRKSL